MVYLLSRRVPVQVTFEYGCAPKECTDEQSLSITLSYLVSTRPVCLVHSLPQGGSLHGGFGPGVDQHGGELVSGARPGRDFYGVRTDQQLPRRNGAITPSHVCALRHGEWERERGVRLSSCSFRSISYIWKPSSQKRPLLRPLKSFHHHNQEYLIE